MGAVVSGSVKALIGGKSDTFEHEKLTVSDVIEDAKSGSLNRQRSAATSFFRMAQMSDLMREQISREGGLGTIVALCQSKSPEVQANCLRTLSELCKSERCRIDTMQSEGWLPMVIGLESKHIAVREAAVSAIWTLADLADAKLKFVQEGVVPWLSKFISASNDAIELIAVKALCKMSQRSDVLPRMVQEGAVEPIFRALNSANKPRAFRIEVMSALATLCTCSASHERIVRIQSGTGLQRLVALCSTQDEDLRLHASIALARLARGPTFARRLLAGGALAPLKRLLKCKDDCAVVTGLEALTALAGAGEDHREAIGRAGVVPPVLRLCVSGRSAVDQAAAALLSALSESSTCCAAIVGGGGRRMLEQCAMDDSASAVARGAARELLDALAPAAELFREAAVRKAVRRFKRLPAEKDSEGVSVARVSSPLPGKEARVELLGVSG